MEILYLLLPLSLVFVLVIGWAFWWAATSGQFEGSDEAAHSILQDDDSTAQTAEPSPEDERSHEKLLQSNINTDRTE